MQDWFNQHKWALLLLLTGALFRLQGLFDYSLNWDELNVLATAKLPWFDIPNLMLRRDFHPPGLPMLLHGWIGLFGDSDLSVRLFAWAFGVLGIAITYLLARLLSGSQPLALLATGLSIFSPFLFRNAQIATAYNVYYALALSSWYCLLRTEKAFTESNRALAPSDSKNLGAGGKYIAPSRGKPIALLNGMIVSFRQDRFGKWLAGYGLCSLIAVQLHAMGMLFLLCQLVYLSIQFWRHRQNASLRPYIAILIVTSLVSLSMLPFYWAAMQPWHLSHAPEVHRTHQVMSWPFLLAAPANFLFLSFEHSLQEAQQPDQLWLPLILGYGLLIGVLAWQRNIPELWTARPALLVIGALPFALSIGLTVVTGIPVFQYRTQLLCLFTLHYWLAVLLLAGMRQKKALLRICALTILGLTVWLQLSQPRMIRSLDSPWKRTATTLSKVHQQGDGIVIYPGTDHLGVLRYFKPAEFGLTERERKANPREENVFHMIQRLDNDYFILSGEDLLQRRDVQYLLALFVRQHTQQGRQVFLIGASPTYQRILQCQQGLLILSEQHQFVPYPCLHLQPDNATVSPAEKHSS